MWRGDGHHYVMRSYNCRAICRSPRPAESSLRRPILSVAPVHYLMHTPPSIPFPPAPALNETSVFPLTLRLHCRPKLVSTASLVFLEVQSQGSQELVPESYRGLPHVSSSFAQEHPESSCLVESDIFFFCQNLHITPTCCVFFLCFACFSPLLPLPYTH